MPALLDRVAAERDKPRTPSTEARTDHPTGNLGELFRRREAPVASGEYVDGDSAARHSAVFACTDLIGRLLSTLPVHEYDRVGGTLRQLTTPPILISPDGELDITAWLYQVVDSLLKRGNAYGLIQRYDLRGWPTQIATVHPDSVGYSRKGRNGPLEWTLEGKPIGKWPGGDLWHMPAYMVAGCPIGLSPISYAAMTIGIGLGVQRFAGQWFRDGMVPTGLLTNEDEVPKTVADLVKDMWRDALAGNREPVVLGDGWKYDAISVAPEESQFLDTMQSNIADVARFFGVDPEEIGGTRAGGSSVVYQNVEQGQIHLLVRTINPWLIRVEKALTALRPRPRFVKLNPDALLRVDAMTRAKVQDIRVRGGTSSPDEVRALEDEQPIPNNKGRRVLWPPGRMQLTEVELKEGADSDAVGAPAQPEGSDRGPNDDVLDLAGVLQKLYLSTEGNVIITPTEARAIANRLGAGLTPELPVTDPEAPDPDAEPVAVGTNGQSPGDA